MRDKPHQFILDDLKNQGAKIGEHALAKWCNEQRKARKKGSLSQDKIDMLNEIGFPWEG